MKHKEEKNKQVDLAYFFYIKDLCLRRQDKSQRKNV